MMNTRERKLRYQLRDQKIHKSRTLKYELKLNNKNTLITIQVQIF